MANINSMKRKIDVVDLTGSDEENRSPAATVPGRDSKHKHARHWRLPTPPASSSQQDPLLNSSQHAPPSQRAPLGYDPFASYTTPSQGERDLWADEPSSTFDATAEVNSSQDFDDNAYQSLAHYGTVVTKVVGVQYYNGQATPGEFVIARREPGNQYDANAIRVENVMRQQIGHIPRNMAAKLAPFIDDGSLMLEGMLTAPKGFYDAPLELRLFGTTEPLAKRDLMQRMEEARLPTNEIKRAGRERQKIEKERAKQREQDRRRLLKEAAKNAGGVRKGGSALEFEAGSSQYANITVLGDDPAVQDMDQIMEKSVSYNPRELRDVVNKYGAGEENLSKPPFAQQPPDLATKLLPYQLQGLAWMLDRENPQLPRPGFTETTQLWKATSKGTFVNIATNYTVDRPTLASGGILADDMGLGKTIQVISLLLADPRRAKQPTLILSPLSVMSNWSGQIQKHVKQEKALGVLTYHGQAKGKLRAADFEQYDVVITTYQTMANEYFSVGSKDKPAPVPRGGGLFSVNWRRVVVDEGHALRNPKTKMAIAASNLIAGSRWILTGTPIVNNLKDLHAHIKFLRLTGGLEQPDVFNGALVRPLNQGAPEASILLQALMSTLCLRRMKDMKFVDLRLPELSSHKYSITFQKHEREKYDAFEQEAKGLLIQYQTRKNNKGQNTYSHLLEVLLRLRQTCNHWQLTGERLTNLMAALEQNKKVKLTPENLKGLQDLLQLSIDSHEECPVCMEILHRPTITACGHVFGRECIERVIETQHKCPMCRAELESAADLVEPAVEGHDSPSGISDGEAKGVSSKVEALLSILKASTKKPGTKTVVFSQWTSFLDIVQHHIGEAGFKYCRLDGSMKPDQRDAAMDALAQDPKCTIMLASLSVCSVGLNLVAANQVILADSWWAPAIEDQAVDRVYRLGQQRPVQVFRLVVEDTIEERVLDIQQDKRKLMMTALVLWYTRNRRPQWGTPKPSAASSPTMMRAPAAVTDKILRARYRLSRSSYLRPVTHEHSLENRPEKGNNDDGRRKW